MFDKIILAFSGLLKVTVCYNSFVSKISFFGKTQEKIRIKQIRPANYHIPQQIKLMEYKNNSLPTSGAKIVVLDVL